MIITPGKLNLCDVRKIRSLDGNFNLAEDYKINVEASYNCIQEFCREGITVYGVNTGFGRLANTVIPIEQLNQLQLRLIASHACGVGEPLDESIVRIMMMLKINTLAQGYSGVSTELIERLMYMYQSCAHPVVPSMGSVGASGDLAPLAHMALPLLGLGEVNFNGEELSGAKWLAMNKMPPIELQAKEGLSLINGTQASCAMLIEALIHAEHIFAAATVAGAMSVYAAGGALSSFVPEINNLTGHRGQSLVANQILHLLSQALGNKDMPPSGRVQDPYSLRCQPQVMGACLDILNEVGHTISAEINSVTDNPLVFPKEQKVISGGNFHAEYLAFAADKLALAISEIGALSERRISMLLDSSLSGLPPFLTEESGLNSGFMIPHVTAAALASANKTLAHPCSVDSIPTSANQEDHVSMSAFGAYRLKQILEHTSHIVGIELLAAVRGVYFHKPMTSQSELKNIFEHIVVETNFRTTDYMFSPDLIKVADMVISGDFMSAVSSLSLPTL